MKVLLVSRSYNNVIGGLEKFTVNLANNLSDHDVQTAIFSFDPKESEMFFPLSNRVVWYKCDIGNQKIKADFWQRVKRQRNLFSILKDYKPDVILCFMFGSFMVGFLPAKFLGIPIVLAERSSPSIYDFTHFGRRWKKAIHILMYFSSAITVQFPSYKNKYPYYLRRKITSIPNSVVIPSNDFILKKDTIKLLFAGRLSEEKNLLPVLEAIKKMQLGIHFYIVGDGPLKETFKDFVSRNELSEQVFFRDFTHDLMDYFKIADVSVMPSLWEGFPNFAAESLAYGVPVIGLQTCDGIRDLVVHSRNGFLLNRDNFIDEFVSLFDSNIENKLRNEQIFLECKRSVSYFESNEIINSWIQFLHAIKCYNFNS